MTFTEDQTQSGRNVILYHANCIDGFAAAFAAWLFLGDSITIYKAISHNTDPKTLDLQAYDRVMFLDVVLNNEEDMQFVIDRCHSVSVIDHHKTAFDKYEKHRKLFDEFWLELTSSGCMLAWKYYHGEAHIPKLFECIQAIDLGKTAEVPFASEIAKALYEIVPRTFEAWKELNDNFLSRFYDLVKGGEIINMMISREIEFLKENAITVKIAGQSIRLVNYSGKAYGSVAMALANDSECQVGGTFCFDSKKKKFKISLRSIGPEIRKIAELFNGGGHDKAASWYCSRVDFNDIMAGLCE